MEESVNNAESVEATKSKIAKQLNKKALIFAIIIIVIFFGLFFWMSPLGPDYNKRVTHEYTVIINPNSVNQYRIMCSLPINLDGESYSEFIESITIEGIANISKNLTQYGEALEIIGTGDAIIKWVAEWSPKDHNSHWNLSMLLLEAKWSSEGFAWSYSENVDLRMRLFHNYSYRYIHGFIGYGHWFDYEIDTIIPEGWGQVPVEITRTYT